MQDVREWYLRCDVLGDGQCLGHVGRDGDGVAEGTQGVASDDSAIAGEGLLLIREADILSLDVPEEESRC